MRAAFACLAVLLTIAPAWAGAPPSRWLSEWPDTDFSQSTVAFEEILSGGPPKDGIPAIDNPRFAPVAEETRLGPDEPVITLSHGGEARAYPLQVLTWHEIVNDEIAGLPVTVTYCPLCNTAIAFDRRHGGRVLDFGVSGKLRHSDMVMYDRQTESWWQQFTGTGIVGEMTGAELTMVPVRVEAWRLFRERHPDGQVLQPPGNFRDYGRNPYTGYDSAARSFLYAGEDPPHGIPPMARVVRVGGRAWLMERVVEAGSLTEDGLTLSWSRGQNSALDSARISEGRDVGNIVVTDSATGALVPHEVTFAFAFHAFHPQGRWMIAR